MKIVVYSVLDDEIESFKLMEEKYNIKLDLHKYYLNINNIC